MLERYYVRPETVDRIRSSWIYDSVDRYVRWLTEQKYNSRSVFRRIPLVVSFGDFARAHGAESLDVLPRYIEPFIDARVAERGRGRKSAHWRKRVSQGIRNPIQQMLHLIIPGFDGRGPRKVENPFEGLAPHFFVYLRQERGLRESSIRHHSHYLHQFASYLQSIEFQDLRQLSPPVLSGFFSEFGQHRGRGTVRGACSVLRGFVRYLYRENILAKDFSSVIEHPLTYRLSNVPRSITWDEVRRMLESVDKRTPLGKRDHAILLLLVSYGLRARVVAALTLDDMDWRNERLRVPERKAGHSTLYPLSPIVGEAILDYLKRGRPQTADRHIFFRTLAPQAPMTQSAVSGTASRYLRKAGVAVSRAGSHTLRHTCVQRLVDANVSFKVIGDYVGHRGPAATRIYSKVAIESLREVGCGDGEEVLQ